MHDASNVPGWQKTPGDTVSVHLVRPARATAPDTAKAVIH